MVGDNIGHSLSVGSGARSAAPDGVVHLCQFVRDSVRNVSTGSRPTVRTENHTILEVDCHAIESLKSDDRGG